MLFVFYIFLEIAVLCVCDVKVNTINIDVNPSNVTKFYHFWKSTGFCPPDPKENVPTYLLSDEQKRNIALIGSLPNNGIKYVRIHWLLNLLTTQSENHGGGSGGYNFTHMDAFLSYLNQNSLIPAFELMGSPTAHLKFGKSGLFWEQLVQTIAKRYIRKFGAEQVSKWRFETWNEPDLKGYNILNFTLPEYLDYVEGCSSGLKNAFSGSKSKWKLGGPAGLFREKKHPLCWGILEACNRLGVTRCPLRFISFHRKGDGTALGLLNGTMELLDVFGARFPGLRNMAVANDEADIEADWSKSLDWRGDVRYAVMVVKVIAGFFQSIGQGRKLKIEVLSNDNGFLNYHPYYFTQRTLFARFQMNATVPRHSQFIRKPVYSAMSLLSLLGDEYFLAEAEQPDPLLTVVATRRKRGKQSFVSVVLAYGNETRSDEGTAVIINVLFGNLPPEGEWKFSIYRLDNVRTNPYEVWRASGRPAFPSRYQRRKMREAEEPKRLVDPTRVTNAPLNVTLKLTIPSLHLIDLCSKSKNYPETVTSVTILNVTWNEVLITWRYKSKCTTCIRTFVVENRAKCSGNGHFNRINPTDTIFLSFHHVGKGTRALIIFDCSAGTRAGRFFLAAH
ncbi:hypothetical protein NQ315_011472 [Exocentrus adspersus]|uniref:Glycosyl hydrolases family 39 N-terminal catalytic domain-containing protein n=1 Tax=Exocentrus adspersus TaxID=1586481 RepID=A0AAV8VV08_9CUCU|nr:hypothetical protein NQ315_011472 [Exocentrus adspersus]